MPSERREATISLKLLPAGRSQAGEHVVNASLGRAILVSLADMPNPVALLHVLSCCHQRVEVEAVRMGV
ncbi:hypothetical protein IW248_005592 [Micromonospora ureilytica]|uniref:Uncharacterized protein n=1 Tax=Micromonospora ureilytica TaxID=709868 RepID=A0ABS0JQH2_9ACTN|nr:hypothetical protein [Micromonospora ureilytica]